MRHNIKTVESAKTHVVRGNKTTVMMSSESRKFCLHGMYVKLEQKREQCFVFGCAYFAVVTSTNRLTRLFSRVLKYCGESTGFNTET